MCFGKVYIAMVQNEFGPTKWKLPNGKICILPKTNIAPENWWLEDDSFPFWGV